MRLTFTTDRWGRTCHLVGGDGECVHGPPETPGSWIYEPQITCRFTDVVMCPLCGAVGKVEQNMRAKG